MENFRLKLLEDLQNLLLSLPDNSDEEKGESPELEKAENELPGSEGAKIELLSLGKPGDKGLGLGGLAGGGEDEKNPLAALLGGGRC